MEARRIDDTSNEERPLYPCGLRGAGWFFFISVLLLKTSFIQKNVENYVFVGYNYRRIFCYHVKYINNGTVIIVAVNGRR